MRTLLAGIVFALVLGAAATAHAYEMRPGWGYATIDDHPFNEPGGAPLPATRAYPRGTIKDLGTPDGWAVRITVYAYNASDTKLYEYTTTERHAVYTAFDQPIDAGTNQIAYLVYSFCRADNTCAPAHRIARPRSSAPPTGGPPRPPGPPGPPAPPVDRDGDGVSPPADCSDTNSTVWPGATEYPGNGIDEDCVAGDQPGRVLATVGNLWLLSGRGARVKRLRVNDAPATATVTVRCLNMGCLFKPRTATVSAKGTADLTRLFRGRLRVGTVIEVRITAPSMIGKVVRYKIRPGRRLPKMTKRCLPPGVTKPEKC